MRSVLWLAVGGCVAGPVEWSEVAPALRSDAEVLWSLPADDLPDVEIVSSDPDVVRLADPADPPESPADDEAQPTGQAIWFDEEEGQIYVHVVTGAPGAATVEVVDHATGERHTVEVEVAAPARHTYAPVNVAGWDVLTDLEASWLPGYRLRETAFDDADRALVGADELPIAALGLGGVVEADALGAAAPGEVVALELWPSVNEDGARGLVVVGLDAEDRPVLGADAAWSGLKGAGDVLVYAEGPGAELREVTATWNGLSATARVRAAELAVRETDALVGCNTAGVRPLWIAAALIVLALRRRLRPEPKPGR